MKAQIEIQPLRELVLKATSEEAYLETPLHIQGIGNKVILDFIVKCGKGAPSGLHTAHILRTPSCKHADTFNIKVIDNAMLDAVLQTLPKKGMLTLHIPEPPPLGEDSYITINSNTVRIPIRGCDNDLPSPKELENFSEIWDVYYNEFGSTIGFYLGSKKEWGIVTDLNKPGCATEYKAIRASFGTLKAIRVEGETFMSEEPEKVQTAEKPPTGAPAATGVSAPPPPAAAPRVKPKAPPEETHTYEAKGDEFPPNENVRGDPPIEGDPTEYTAEEPAKKARRTPEELDASYVTRLSGKGYTVLPPSDGTVEGIQCKLGQLFLELHQAQLELAAMANIPLNDTDRDALRAEIKKELLEKMMS